MSCPEVAKVIQAIATTLGILGAGGFFVWKAWLGYNNVNLSLGIDTKRCHGSADGDIVSALVTIRKGSNTALSLLHGEVRFSEAIDGQPRVLQLHRLEVTEGQNQSLSVNWSRVAEERALFVSPGEETHFACSAEVPRGRACDIDVVLLGKKRLPRNAHTYHKGFLAQWRAGTVALPLEETECR
jgi:hypothetical protein